MSTLVQKSTLALAITLASAQTVYAQGVGQQQQLEPVVVSGSKPVLDPNLPNSTASKTAEELREQQNVFNPEDILRNLPNTTVRKRYAGDRNALMGGRSFATSQAPRGLVFMDGYLISNFLGRFDAPRWNMVAPEEITRMDVLYGPFSAIYPGNSIGTTVAITTSIPKKFEASARIAAQFQTFDEYGLKDRYDNNQVTALLGSRLQSGAWYRLMFNRQDSTSQPQQYFAINANSAGVFTPPTGPGSVTPVTGVLYDVGPNGLRRAILGANAGAIDHTVQQTAKVRAGYDTPGVSADGFVAWWRNDTLTRNQTFLKDTAGNAVWSGRVSQDGNVFNIPAASFGPFSRDEAHVQTGFTVKTRNAKGWNASLVTSYYQILDDLQRTALNPDPMAANGGTGIAVQRDGTRWRTFEVQGTYSPTAGDWTGGAHALTFGMHANDYRLKQSTASLADWRVGDGTPTQFVGGDTRLFALYAQDAWRFAPNWIATTGVRFESWKSMNGAQQYLPGPSVAYPEKNFNATSPKLSIAWQGIEDTTLRASIGRGTRFATVTELFQAARSGNSIVINDPNLKPERSDAIELTAERRFDNAGLRATLFQDDVRDTILNQTNIAVFPNVTNVQNIDRVRTRGVEFVGDMQNVGIKGLSFEGNISFNDSKILENKNAPNTVGKNWIRVPRVRSAITGLYKANAQWSFATTYRYQGRQWNELTNIDINPDVFGGASRVRQWDVRALWKPVAGMEVALGVDNLTDARSYQGHPFPGRTIFTELRYALR